MRIIDWSSDVCSSDLAAELRPFRPGDARMEGFQPRQLEPDVGARLQEKVRANPEAMRGEVEHFDGDAARPALPETGVERDLGAPGAAFPGRNPGRQLPGEAGNSGGERGSVHDSGRIPTKPTARSGDACRTRTDSWRGMEWQTETTTGGP